MKTSRMTYPLLAMALLLTACDRAAQVDRAGRLLSMAGEEAANIPNKIDRFTRQLHIAETQLRTDRKPDAAKTLALAQDTLKASGKEDFDDFHRIAAWTSISQLSRQAGDRDLALKSADAAQEALNDVQPPADRPQYVLSLAGELAELRGKDAAIELVNSGGAWAAEIIEPGTRRTALIAFTNYLLNVDAFENARVMLKRDPDPAWRTDMFLSLADTYSNRQKLYERGIHEPRMASSPSASADAAASSPTFGKDVRYENVYKRNGGE
jgi:hypothetical protein